jgi:fermentation-respiration switch protein FrsA (DUF1100 family)
LAVAMIAALSEPAYDFHLRFASHFNFRDLLGTVLYDAGRPFKMRKQFLHDLDQYDKKSVTADLNHVLLVFYSPADAVVDIEHSECIFQLARQPKSFLLLDEADHPLSRLKDAEYVVDVLAAWIARNIGEANQPDLPRQSSPPGVEIVSEAA